MKTSKTLLVTRPSYDPTTHYCYHWSQPVIEKAKQKTFRVLDIADDKVTRSILESYLKKQEPQLIFLNGHGSPTVVAGQNEEPILMKDNLNAIPTGSIVYVRSCDVGRVLGKQIALIASAFIGYSKAFGFYRDYRYMRQPTKDPLAKFSFDPSNLVVTTLLKGNTTIEAHQRSRSTMRRNLEYLLSSKATSVERQCATPLWRNYKYQVCLGDGEAKIV